jgi:SAM-dependent methyltransferase
MRGISEQRRREWGESFGADPDRYDRTRPRYPEPLIARIAAAGAEVLDVGCGTGIVARQLQPLGCRALGVEPDERMAALARRHGVEVEVARFEEWDPAGRAFDAVAAGQTWHWVDPVAGARKAAEALRPGGLLAVFWNVFETPSPLHEAFAEVYARVMPDLPPMPSAIAGYDPLLARVEDGIRETGAFGEPERRRHDWAREYTRREWLDQVPSFGGYARLEPAAPEELLAGVGAAVDAAGGRFTMGYAAVLVAAGRIAPSASSRR